MIDEKTGERSFCHCEDSNAAFKVENVIDITGAGDRFCSGFLAAFARGEEILYCAKLGNATGAHRCMEKGATEGIKSYSEMLNFITKTANEKCWLHLIRR